MALSSSVLPSRCTVPPKDGLQDVRRLHGSTHWRTDHHRLPFGTSEQWAVLASRIGNREPKAANRQLHFSLASPAVAETLSRIIADLAHTDDCVDLFATVMAKTPVPSRVHPGIPTKHRISTGHRSVLHGDDCRHRAPARPYRHLRLAPQDGENAERNPANERNTIPC